MAFAAGPLSSAACAAFGGDETTAAGAPEGGDAVAPDVPTEASADGEAAADAAGDGDVVVDAQGPNPGALIDDGFEMGAGCGSWVPITSTLSAQPGGHSGARACLACSTAPGASIYKFVPADAGGPYQLVAFLRAPAASPASGALVSITARPPDGGLTGYAEGSLSLTASWQQAQAVLASADVDTDRIVARVSIDGDGGGCVLIDDVLLVKE